MTNKGNTNGVSGDQVDDSIVAYDYFSNVRPVEFRHSAPRTRKVRKAFYRLHMSSTSRTAADTEFSLTCLKMSSRSR
jgi:hypothetical protein